MSARDRILAKLKANAPSTAGELPNVADWYATHRSVEAQADKAKRFRHFIELAHAEVYSVSRGGWLQKLWEVLDAKHSSASCWLPPAPPTANGLSAN